MRRADVAVVGGGPAGIGAASAAVESGSSVVLIDEADEIGGHLRWTLAVQPDLTGGLQGKRGVEVARWASRALREGGVEVLTSSVAWGLFEDRVLGVAAGETSFQLSADRVIIASGATDTVLPFPGWELPGVMTVTAALKFMHVHRVLPGRRFAVVGLQHLAESVAADIDACGGEVVVRVETVSGLETGGNAQVEWVTRDADRFKIDTVVLALGRQPDPELALQAQCAVAYSDLDAAFVPLRTEVFETSLAGVFVVGDAAGICTTAEALAEGRVAGLAATDGAGLDHAIEQLRRLRSPERAEEVDRLRAPVLPTA